MSTYLRRIALTMSLAAGLTAMSSLEASAQDGSSADMGRLTSAVQSLCVMGNANPAYALHVADQAGWIAVDGYRDSSRVLSASDGSRMSLQVVSATAPQGIPIYMCSMLFEPSAPSAEDLLAATKAWVGLDPTEHPAPDRWQFRFIVTPNGKYASAVGLSSEQIFEAKRDGRFRLVVAWWQPDMAAIQYSAPASASAQPPPH